MRLSSIGCGRAHAIMSGPCVPFGRSMMTDLRRIDEATLLWAAALVERIDPAELLTRVDLRALTVIVAEADACTDPVDAAAALLVGVVRDRPFHTSNAAVAWLAAVDVLAAARCRIAVDAAHVVELCDSIGSDALGPADVAAALRTWRVEDGVACPACGRRVYRLDAAARRSMMPGTARFELVARCAFEHGVHGRAGRPIDPPADRLVEPHQPVLARGECGSFLVAGERASVVVSPFCDDPPIVRVVEADDVRPGDLVGRWDPLVERSRTVGFVPAEEVRLDAQGRVDLARLNRAVRASRQRSAAAEIDRDTATRPVGVS